ncbi:hypothetical protein LTR64_006252 [Lithohypha guttulata]|uniref:uncharacterized protein n=1 Tax=Lithohypha guttulata TaxID=1690604 RepID=UPI002DDE27A3|nr:hypothetical protein LTR51_001950 [Lithohypha guttulata]
MLKWRGLSQPEFSPSVVVAPRSTRIRNGQFSSPSALVELPIRKVQDVEGFLVQDAEHNPALLTVDSNFVHVNDRSWFTNNTFVHRQTFLPAVKEEEHNIHVRWHYPFPATSSQRKALPVINGHDTRSAFHCSSIDRSITGKGFLDNESVIQPSRFRSLTPALHIDAFAMPKGMTAPGSPPELTDSHSFTSDSHASQFSVSDDLSAGTMNFEEIILDDENHSVHTRSAPREVEHINKPNTHQKPIHRPVLAALQIQQTRYPELTSKTAKSAVTPYTKRTFTRPTVNPNSSHNAQRTYSESPALHENKSVPRLGQHEYSSTSASSLTLPSRRGSWQPTRKTIYEIEAEYHDSDDELPDDTSLFNVPLSPFVTRSHLAGLSPQSSAQGSPERRTHVSSPAPIPLSHARTMPNTPSKSRNGSRGTTQRKQKLNKATNHVAQSNSASTSPQSDLRFGRTKSWNLVMADLDHEARIIAEKLDFHHEASTKLDAAIINQHRSSAPGAIPLPPIQKGTLDFMPSSKEKEAVLSRTRPSWLPPKDPREEKRHLAQYKQMMQASIEAEQKKEHVLKQQRRTDDGVRDSLHGIWTYYVDPTTDLLTIDKRVNDLCWRGIPPKLRGAVWQRRIGNPMNLTDQSYTLAVGRAKEIKSKPTEELSEHEKTLREWFADIDKDAETAFPDLSMFQRHGLHWQHLIDVCEAYTVYRADIGYFYGVQLMAALMLTQVPTPAEAFRLMANCFRRSLPFAFQTGDEAVAARTYDKVKSTLDIKFPQLHAYLFLDQQNSGLGFSGREVFEHMFKTVFANGLDLDRLCRIWDIWIFEGDRYLIRTAVALLGALQSQIFEIQGDVHLRRRNIQEMLGWGPYNRTGSGYWKFDSLNNCDLFVDGIRAAGRLDYTGH